MFLGVKRFRKFVSTVILVSVATSLTAAHANTAPGVRIMISKKERQLWLSRDGKVIRRYPISLGRMPLGPKELRGDGKTPVGVYTVYEKRPKSKFHRFLALSYPSTSDAERALRAGLISADTWADIWLADTRHAKPPWNTRLGGFVGIHGSGGLGTRARLRQLLDWTDGCIALSDHDVEELYELTPIGTVVEIYE